MLEQLSNDLEVFDLYSKRSRCEPLLHKTLVAVYGDILAFCRHARRVFVNDQGKEKSQGALLVFLKVQWAPFEEQFGRIKSDLEYHIQNLDKITSAITLTSTLDIQEEMNRRRSLERSMYFFVPVSPFWSKSRLLNSRQKMRGGIFYAGFPKKTVTRFIT